MLAHSKELTRTLDEDGRQLLEIKKSELKLPKETSHMTEDSDEGRSVSGINANARTRCPYCAEGGKFRAMIRDADARMVCNNCGHVACSSDPDFVCNCRNCGQLALFTRNR